MALADIIRNGVALANSITKTGALQETVTLKRWIGQDDAAKPSYTAALTLTGLVEHKHRRDRRPDGSEIVSTTQVTFLTDIPAVKAEGRKNPIDERDVLIFANGETGPILWTDGGLSDPKTGRGYLTQVFLG